MKTSDAQLPRHKPGLCKDWWSTELTEMKNQSLQIQALWVAEGRPRSGPTQNERLRVQLAYKRLIRDAQKAPKQDSWNKLHQAMECDDTNQFWKSWRHLYNGNSNHFAPVVDGCSDKKSIAEVFRSSFESNCTPNDANKVENLNTQFSESYSSFTAAHHETCNCSRYGVDVQTTIDAICCLKGGKCGDNEDIHAEHFQHAPLNFLVRLTQLFNAMLAHSHVPK